MNEIFTKQVLFKVILNKNKFIGQLPINYQQAAPLGLYYSITHINYQQAAPLGVYYSITHINYQQAAPLGLYYSITHN